MLMSDQTRAVLWMCGGVLSFSFMAISGRELSSELSTSQILFVRSVVGFSVMVLVMCRVGWGEAWHHSFSNACYTKYCTLLGAICLVLWDRVNFFGRSVCARIYHAFLDGYSGGSSVG